MNHSLVPAPAAVNHEDAAAAAVADPAAAHQSTVILVTQSES